MMVGLGAFVGLSVLLSVVAALAVPAAIVWLIVVAIRNLSGETRRPRPRYDPAAEQLRYRYARGEITEAEFEQGMRLLGYERVS